MIDLEAYYTQLKFDALRLWEDFIILYIKWSWVSTQSGLFNSYLVVYLTLNNTLCYYWSFYKLVKGKFDIFTYYIAKELSSRSQRLRFKLFRHYYVILYFLYPTF